MLIPAELRAKERPAWSKMEQRSSDSPARRQTVSMWHTSVGYHRPCCESDGRKEGLALPFHRTFMHYTVRCQRWADERGGRGV